MSIKAWKDRAIDLASIADILVDLSYMGPQLQFVQDLLVKGDLDEIVHALAPGLNLTDFEILNVTQLESQLESNRVSSYVIFHQK